MTEKSARRGVFAGGNFIVDHAKVIDVWPEQDTLAKILSESRSNGGGPYNILKDLSRLCPGLPLEACGLIGADADGDWIIDDCRDSGINVEQLHRTAKTSTSYTDVMNVVNTSRRTYFYQSGASALLQPDHFDFSRTSARIFSLGYLMLLESLDQTCGNGLTGSATVLRNARQAGLLTAVDCVSIPKQGFREIVMAAFRETDILFINEFEIGQVLGRTVEPSRQVMQDAAMELARCADRSGVQVVLHAANGAIVASADGEPVFCPALAVPQSAIAGTTGAGDAFAAGYLLGRHENHAVSECLRYAVCSAAQSLSQYTPSDGMDELQECLGLEKVFGYQEF